MTHDSQLRSMPHGDHRYELPSEGSLPKTDEIVHAQKIQAGNLALQELTDLLWPQISDDLRLCEASQILGSKLGDMAQQALAESVDASASGDLTVDRDTVDLTELVLEHLERYVDKYPKRFPEVPLSSKSWFSERLPAKISIKLYKLKYVEKWRALEIRAKSISVLVQTHMRLVQSYARKYMRQWDDINDLMNEGAMILRRAAIKFRVEKGVRFSSYAHGALKHDLRSAANKLFGDPGRSKHSLDGFQVVRIKGMRSAVERAQKVIVSTSQLKDSSVRQLQLYYEGDLDPFEEAVDKETYREIQQNFSRLSLLEKQTLLGHTLHGYSFRDLAKRYPHTAKTLGKVFDQACEKLCRKVEPPPSMEKSK